MPTEADPFAGLYPAEGSNLGRYENLTEIGEGAMGKVYRAFDPQLHIDLAVKVLPKGGSSEEQERRFRREIQLLASVNMPGVIRIFDCGKSDGWQYFTMELIDGVTLLDHVGEQDASVEERLDWILNLAEILERLHEAGIVHRDLKPTNVMISNTGELRLMDFGIAKNVESMNELSSITVVNTRPGTPFYMSPDKTDELQNTEIAKKADVYSLAVLSYELLSGRFPYDIENLNVTECIFVVREEPALPLREREVDVSPEVEAVFMKALEKDPDKRPTATEFIRELRQALGRNTLAQPRQKKRNPIAMLMSVAALLLILVGLHFYLVSLRQPTPAPVKQVALNSEDSSLGHSSLSDSQSTTGNVSITPEDAAAENLSARDLTPDKPKEEPRAQANDEPKQEEPSIKPTDKPVPPVVITKPKEPSPKEKYAALMTTGNAHLTAGEWLDAAKAFKGATELPGFAKDEAALRGIDRARSGLAVSNALEAKKKGEWPLVLKLAKRAIRFDSANSKAHQLKREAEMNLQPQVLIAAQADGKPVKGAQILLNGKVTTFRTPSTIPVKMGETYLIRINAPRTKDRLFHPFERKLTVDTGGLIQFTALLKTVGPVNLPDLRMSLLPVNAGSFRMGSDEGRRDETPVHPVRITHQFWVSQTEVTQKQFEAIMLVNPSRIKGARLPIANISWETARLFCDRLNAREQNAGRLPRGYVYRLPTEAEWEYACRAGSKTAYSFGGNAAELGKHAWYRDNSTRTVHDVARKAANAWGLHDMHGNVREWVYDSYGAYTPRTAINPSGPGRGNSRIVRGGSFKDTADRCTSTRRERASSASKRYADAGFRLVLAPLL